MSGFKNAITRACILLFTRTLKLVVGNWKFRSLRHGWEPPGASSGASRRRKWLRREPHGRGTRTRCSLAYEARANFAAIEQPQVASRSTESLRRRTDHVCSVRLCTLERATHMPFSHFMHRSATVSLETARMNAGAFARALLACWSCETLQRAREACWRGRKVPGPGFLLSHDRVLHLVNGGIVCVCTAIEISRCTLDGSA